MRRHTALGFWLALVALGADRSEAGPPNVILIYADDLGWGDVGFNGRREWATPNLDRLAARGTKFARFYTAAVVCAPSRAALLSGKFTVHNGVSRNDEDLPGAEVTLAEALRARGYATALYGKWHAGKARPGEAASTHPLDQGFEEFFGFTDAVHAWEKFPKFLWEGRERRPVSGYADDLFTDRGVAFLKQRKADRRPFFLYLPLISAHFNVEAPAEEVALHRGKYVEKDPEVPLRATYAAQVTRLDREVGRVVAAVEELGLSGETLIVFTSDHGATFERGNLGASRFHDSNRPFRGQKRTLWEGGIRVPAVAAWPGHVPAGRDSHEVLHMTDLFPTLLALAGGAPDPAWKVDGLNVLPALTGAGAVPERALFWEWRGEGASQLAAMRGSLKLVVMPGNPPELYDVEDDPSERRNLASEFPEVVRDLEARLKAWLASGPAEGPGR